FLRNNRASTDKIPGPTRRNIIICARYPAADSNEGGFGQSDDHSSGNQQGGQRREEPQDQSDATAELREYSQRLNRTRRRVLHVVHPMKRQRRINLPLWGLDLAQAVKDKCCTSHNS